MTLKRIPKLATVSASVDRAAGVMFLSCAACAPPVVAVPLRAAVDSQIIGNTGACLVSDAHEEIRFGQVCRDVMTDHLLQSFFWQATGRTLYVTRQFHSHETFSNDGHMLLCATASLHKVARERLRADLLAQADTRCSYILGPTIGSCSPECSSSGLILLWCASRSRLCVLLLSDFVLQETVSPFQEEQWLKFSIVGQDGGAVLANFFQAKKCTRCEMINIHPETGLSCASQPLSLIKRHRQGPPQFGIVCDMSWR